MRTENIEVTFKIPIPVDKPDLNGVIYSKEAIRNAYKNVKNIPIEMPNNDGEFFPIGVAQEVELIEDENGMYITGVGIVWHKYVNLSEYLCDCIGASTGKNVCACVTDLAKYNDMTIAELFDKYEGYPEKESYKNKIINDTEIEDIIAKHFNVSDCLLKVVHTIHGESVVAEIVE